MKARIKVASNIDEIEEARKLSFKKEPDIETVTTILYFHAKDVGDFYLDPLDDDRDILIYLYPNRLYRAVYDEQLVKDLEFLFSKEVISISSNGI